MDGKRNVNMNLTIGTSLVASIINSKRIMTIQFSEYGESKCSPKYPRDAFNGKGTDVNVFINKAQTPSIYTIDVNSGKIKKEKFFIKFIELGHELIHGIRNMNGEGESYENKETYHHVYFGPNPATVNMSNVKTEELVTTGLTGHYKYTENKLRKEHSLNIRINY